MCRAALISARLTIPQSQSQPPASASSYPLIPSILCNQQDTSKFSMIEYAYLPEAYHWLLIHQLYSQQALPCLRRNTNVTLLRSHRKSCLIKTNLPSSVLSDNNNKLTRNRKLSNDCVLCQHILLCCNECAVESFGYRAAAVE